MVGGARVRGAQEQAARRVRHAPRIACRVLSLLGEAQRLYAALEDGRGASHCRYLRALVHDAMGQAAERDADAAACVAPLPLHSSAAE